MSRRSAGDEMMEDIAGGCIVGIFLALWAAIAALIVAIVKGAQISPEDQLRKMGAQQVYGAQIVGQPCPTCEEPNEESAMLCFRCGKSMTQSRDMSALLDSEFVKQLRVDLGKLAAKPSHIREGKTYVDAEIPIAVAIGVGLLLFLLFIPLFF